MAIIWVTLHINYSVITNAMQIHFSVSHQRTLRVYFKEISFDFFPKGKKKKKIYLLFFELKKQKQKDAKKNLIAFFLTLYIKENFLPQSNFCPFELLTRWLKIFYTSSLAAIWKASLPPAAAPAVRFCL